jgi:hypothetical protein
MNVKKESFLSLQTDRKIMKDREKKTERERERERERARAFLQYVSSCTSPFHCPLLVE